METIKVINKRLETKYGKAFDGRPLYRVVFSDTEFESRFEEFEDYHGEIFIRRVKEYRTVPKYSYIDGKHVLEYLFFGEFPDRPFINSAYEPLWTFIDKEGNKLYPIWPAVEHVVECHLNGFKKALHGKVERDFKAEEQAAKDKEIDEFASLLGVDGDGVMDMKGQKVNFVKPVLFGGIKPFISE